MDVLDDLEDITLDTPDAPEVRESVLFYCQKYILAFFTLLYQLVQ